jgi:DNA helicase HerA-like ATPase
MVDGGQAGNGTGPVGTGQQAVSQTVNQNISQPVGRGAAEPVVLGTIIGKSTTREFSFQVENETKVFEYLKVFHRVFGDVLCQVVEITATLDDRIALCNIIGYRDPDGAIKSIRIPFDVGSRVMRADDDFIRSIIKLSDEHGALFGKLEGRGVPVYLDLRKILTKHVAVLAKSGAGKSYSVGVMIEEVLEKGVPVLIIDPHGEYGTLGQPNTNKEDVEKLKWFRCEPRTYNVTEYADPSIAPGAKQLRLSNQMTQQELVQMIPTKLTGTQIGILYAALRNIEQISFDNVIASLNAEESNAKWGLINILEHLRTYNIFSNDPTPYDEIVAPGVCSIINLRGIPPEIQSILVFKLTKDLFELRKRGAVPPFFLVIEEAHNFCPERSYGETTASKTIRQIASEGRKFGLGLCVISQRPARIDKSVVSQCTTQVILKVTNPNDLKAISASVEGLTAESEKEIANLPIGTALVTGIVEVPLLINVRPRRTLHGGHSVDIFTEIAEAAKRPKLPRPVVVPVASPSAAATPAFAMPQQASRQPRPVPPQPVSGIPSSVSSHPASELSSTQEQPVASAMREDVRERHRKASPKIEEAATPEQPKATVVRNQAAAPAAAAVAPAPVLQQAPAAEQTPLPNVPTRPAPVQPIAVLRPKRGIMDQLLKDKPLSSVRQILVPAFLVTCQQGTESFRLVVERIEGNIVTGIDSFTSKRVPDLKHLTKEELKLLQDAYTVKALPNTKEMQQSAAVQSLVEKGYLLQSAEGITLSEKYLFQKLSKVRSDDDLEFTRVTDAAMLEPSLNELQVRMMLTPFVAVKGAQECWILRIIVK